MPRFLLVSILFLLASCGPAPQVDERMDYWKSEVDSFLVNERSLQEVHSWLRSHNVIYTLTDKYVIDGNWTITLEKVYIENWRCEWIDIQLVVLVDNTLSVQGYDLVENRACLW